MDRTQAGRVESINTSNGGVPKGPRPSANVAADGIAGDRQRDLRFHGGPTRAVSLYSLERVQALRRAYDATMTDKGFREDARQRKLEVDPRTGEYVEGVIRTIAALPEDLIAKAAQMTRK